MLEAERQGRCYTTDLRFAARLFAHFEDDTERHAQGIMIRVAQAIRARSTNRYYGPDAQVEATRRRASDQVWARTIANEPAENTGDHRG
jgi:hypothetical protein